MTTRKILVVLLRDYEPSDAEMTRTVFFRAVHETAAADYTEEQRDAWAPPMHDFTGWNTRLASNRTIVAVEAEQVVGFSDASATGYVDMMFVSPDFTGRGVAGMLLRHVLDRARRAGAQTATTHASLTARGFFEHAGFEVVEQGRPVRLGVTLTNFAMVKTL